MLAQFFKSGCDSRRDKDQGGVDKTSPVRRVENFFAWSGGLCVISAHNWLRDFRPIFSNFLLCEVYNGEPFVF